jgi:hypothetical protein
MGCDRVVCTIAGTLDDAHALIGSTKTNANIGLVGIDGASAYFEGGVGAVGYFDFESELLTALHWITIRLTLETGVQGQSDWRA